MKKLTALLLAAACALATPASTIPAQAQALNAQEADIRAFIQDVAKQTGRTFIVDPRVKGTVSVYSTGLLSENELFEVFLSTLRANGLVAIPTASGAFRIAPEEGAAQQPGTTGRSGEGFSTQVFRLSHIDAAAAAETVRPLIGRQGQVIANRQSNTIVVADYADNLRRIRGLVAELDQDRAAVRTVTLQNSSAAEMATVAERLLGVSGDGSRVVTIVPIPSSNSLLLRGDPAAVERLAPVLEDLDRRAESQADVRVVFLRHASAEQLLPVLQEIVGQVGAAPAAGAEGAAPVARRATIARYAGGNALVINADPETQRTLADVIRQLDQRRQQVLVEAIVVEISDTAAKELGVQFLFSGTEGNSTLPFVATNYSDNAPSLLTAAGAVLTRNSSDDRAEDLASAAISQLLGASGALIGAGGRINDDALFGVIINAVKRDVGSNILSTPSVMTLDNEEATILVGQEVPITTSEQLREGTTNPFRTVQRQNVGVQLDVKPQVNDGGQITLALRQEVSSIAGPVSASFNDLVLNKREIETTVIVDDGEIVALGGLLDDSERESATRVPLLGDIPLAGALFRSKGRERQKTNLMVFIRPRIVGGLEDARAITGPRLEQMRDAQMASTRSRRSSLDEIARRYIEEQAQRERARAASPAPSATPPAQ